jgi:hypothetical protein
MEKGEKRYPNCQSREEAGRRGRWYGVEEIRTAFAAGFNVPKARHELQSLLSLSQRTHNRKVLRLSKYLAKEYLQSR